MKFANAESAYVGHDGGAARVAFDAFRRSETEFPESRSRGKRGGGVRIAVDGRHLRAPIDGFEELRILLLAVVLEIVDDPIMHFVAVLTREGFFRPVMGIRNTTTVLSAFCRKSMASLTPA